MKPLVLAGLICLFAGGAFAEIRGRGPVGRAIVVKPTVPFRTFGSASGFGSVVFPGTGNPPPVIPFATFPVNPFGVRGFVFADRLAATISGTPGFTGVPARKGFFRGGFGGRFGGGFGDGFGGFGGAFPYPVFVGGGGYEGYPYPPEQQPQQPGATIVYPPQPPPQVTINQNFSPDAAKSSVREYGPGGSSGAQPEASNMRIYEVPARAPQSALSDDQILFLIALKDSSIYSAVAYWVQGDALHYVTPQGKHNQVSLDLVDRPVTERLNAGRKVEFQLPAAR